jgi:hypothetical protein
MVFSINPCTEVLVIGYQYPILLRCFLDDHVVIDSSGLVIDREYDISLFHGANVQRWNLCTRPRESALKRPPL